MARAKKRASADDWDENGDTPATAQLRTMFDASYKRQSEALHAAQTEVETRKGRVTPLKASAGGEGGSSTGGDTAQVYTVKEQSAGWFAVVDADGKDVTKNLRKSDLAEFDGMNDVDKMASSI